MGQFSSSMAAHPRTNEVELTPPGFSHGMKNVAEGTVLTGIYYYVSFEIQADVFTSLESI